MRKSKTKFSSLVMIAMILIAILYVYVDNKNIHITAEELVAVYTANTEKADEKFLNKKMELYGKVKSYYSFRNKPNLLELKTGNSKIKIFCSFLSAKDDSVAATLTSAVPVIINGIFRGIKDDNSPEEIYIDVNNISINKSK